MATKYYNFSGRVAYAHLYEPDEFRGVKRWKLSFYPDNVEEVKKAGIQLEPKEDTGEFSGVDGTYFTFRRPVSREIKGEEVRFTPATITTPNGDVLVGWHIDDNGDMIRYVSDDFKREDGSPKLIGNNSKIILNVCVYDTAGYGKGNRFESVKVVDLVEYEPPVKNSENDTVVKEKGEKIDAPW